MAHQFADHLFVSNAIYTATEAAPISGYVAVREEQIVCIGNQNKEKWIGPKTIVHDMGDRLITPGYHDNHTFFTGTLVLNKGVNLSKASSEREAIDLVAEYMHMRPAGSLVLGHSLAPHSWGGEFPENKTLDRFFPDIPVILFNEERDKCWINTKAEEKYRFTGKDLSSEAMVLIFKDIAEDKAYIKEEFKAFAKELSSRGITSIKDIAYDDYLGILPVLEELEKENELMLRVHFASQPVQEAPDLNFAEEATWKYRGDFLNFQGIKLMVDGIIPEFTGDLLEPYANLNTTNKEKVDYEILQEYIINADKRGIKCCMNVDGDAAVRRSLDIFEECRRINGPSSLRHSLSDVSLCQDQDVPRIKELNLSVEVYLQFLLLFPSQKDAYMREFLGEDREKYFNNFGMFAKEGINITAGTDLPLFYPHIGDSIYTAAGRLFADSDPEAGWHKERGLTVGEVLNAWTKNGAWHCSVNEHTGTLQAGKKADIVVLDRNVFETPMDKIRSTSVILTMSNGRIAYEKKEEKV